MEHIQFSVPDTEVKFYCRAKYYRTPEGETKLAQIQQMGFPAFRIPGFEEVRPEELAPLFEEAEETAPDDGEEGDRTTNAARAFRRARINAFDKILANSDLDTFGTFTLSPEAIRDRAEWDDAYKVLKTWLSNGVQRRGLKYVICPERHKNGGIHFHGIMNSPALRLNPAKNARNGLPLTHNGEPLYNIVNWSYGFTSAALIRSGTSDREKVAKYIFKYMGKQGSDGMIGGRYALTGGALAAPFYLYGNTPDEFRDGRTPTASRESEHSGILYREWNYI